MTHAAGALAFAKQHDFSRRELRPGPRLPVTAA